MKRPRILFGDKSQRNPTFFSSIICKYLLLVTLKLSRCYAPSVAFSVKNTAKSVYFCLPPMRYKKGFSEPFYVNKFISSALVSKSAPNCTEKSIFFPRIAEGIF